MVGALIGLVLGAMVGWAFSVDHRENVPRGKRLALYAGTVLLALGALIAMMLR